MDDHWYEEDGDYAFHDSESGETLRVETSDDGKTWMALHSADVQAFPSEIFDTAEEAMEYADEQMPKLRLKVVI